MEYLSSGLFVGLGVVVLWKYRQWWMTLIGTLAVLVGLAELILLDSGDRR